MNQDVPEKVISLVELDQKVLHNNLAKIQWPELNDKQQERVKKVISQHVSNFLFGAFMDEK